ncbi:MAG: hypothetical protein IKA61_00010 [Clostridia bacterium]|nr:hypothetical protein [Clostridia bacterium]
MRKAIKIFVASILIAILSFTTGCKIIGYENFGYETQEEMQNAIKNELGYPNWYYFDWSSINAEFVSYGVLTCSQRYNFPNSKKTYKVLSYSVASEIRGPNGEIRASVDIITTGNDADLQFLRYEFVHDGISCRVLCPKYANQDNLEFLCHIDFEIEQTNYTIYFYHNKDVLNVFDVSEAVETAKILLSTRYKI